MIRCRTLSVIEVGASTWRQITGSVSRSSIRTVAISLKLSNAALLLGGLMPLVWQASPSSSRAGVEFRGWMIGDAAEHGGEPGLRIDVVQLGGLDQREHRGGTFATPIGAGE